MKNIRSFADMTKLLFIFSPKSLHFFYLGHVCTRCVSYFRASLNRLINLHLVEKNRDDQYRLTLFGLYLITCVNKDAFKGKEKSSYEIYSTAFKNPVVFYDYLGKIDTPDTPVFTVEFINSLAINLPAEHQGYVSDLLNEFFEILSKSVKFQKNEYGDFTGIKLRKPEDKSEDLFNQFWEYVINDERYEAVLESITFDAE